MGREKIKESMEIAPEPMPEITPQMIQKTLEVLESKGMVYRTENGAYVPTDGGWKLLTEIKPMKEEIVAYGHPNITSTHTTTLEITKAVEIKKDADCIIGVRANKSCRDLSKGMKDALKDGRKIEITIESGDSSDKIIAYGSLALKLTHSEDIVIRKSDFIDGRTLAILADKSANDLSQDLVERLRNNENKIKVTLEIK